MTVVNKGKLFLVLILTLLVLSACGQESATEDGNNENNSGSHEDQFNNDILEQEREDAVVQSGLEFMMTVEQFDNSFSIEMVLTNVSDDIKHIDFSSGHQYDVIIREKNGETLYNYAADKMFTQVIISEELAPGEKLEFHDESDVMESLSSSLEIATKLNIYQIDGESISDNPFQLMKQWTP